MINPALEFYVGSVNITGNIAVDVPRFLVEHGCPGTAEHCRFVAAQARQLAQHWASDIERAETAGWLHDISAVVPGSQRIALAEALGLEILPEERLAPVLIHQKLSVVIAGEVFKVIDPQILSAIGCHTTLKENSSTLDKIVFVADKLAWDQAGEPPYYAGMLQALEHSLDQAVLVYLEYLWQKRHRLPALHPWELAAYQQLLARRDQP